MPAHASASQRSRSRRALVIVLVLVLALAGAAVAATWGVQRWLAGQVEHIGDPFASITERPQPAASAAPGAQDDTLGGAMNILVLGSDSRISAGDPNQWEQGAQRTDTIMLVHLPAARDAAYVMSFPRDSWVDVPGYGEQKINAAFSYGGPALLIQTIEQLTQVRVDHFVVTDFESFVRITDALGGVRMTLTQDLAVGGTVVPAGKQQLLTGEQALRFVRERKTLARGDFDRVQRQQAWMRAIVAKMRNDGTLHNPVTSARFLDVVSRSVATDDGLDQAVMRDLQDRAKDLGSTDLTFFTVPFEGTGRSPDGAQSIVVLDRAALDPLMAAVASDTLGPYLEANQGSLDVLPPVVE
ncbi:LCP family protein [Cellulomonas telluris]|uniref:LCP family protein n=1 Tax=Cellulomonas telluris TaxID=2306636 RepID=UPI001FE40474|nr:LCP family protein [Cellulomonas telluris]